MKEKSLIYAPIDRSKSPFDIAYITDECVICRQEGDCVEWFPENHVHSVPFCSQCFEILIKTFDNVGGVVCYIESEAA